MRQRAIRTYAHSVWLLARGKEQLISMIHYLEKREEESKQENLELKELIKELQEAHNQKVMS